MQLSENGKTLKMRRPWDMHTHLRSPAQVGEELFREIVRLNSDPYAVIVIEPNAYLDTSDPNHQIETKEDVDRYRDLVYKARPRGSRCRFYFLIKVTNHTKPEELDKALDAEDVLGIKIYPEGPITTGSHVGLSDFFGTRTRENFFVVRKKKKIKQSHSEMPGVTSSRREYAYHHVLEEWAASDPETPLFIEHVSDHRTLALAERYRNVYCTITGHHLRLTEDDAFAQVDHCCRPNIKFPEDRDGLVLAVISGNKKIISITDSAFWEYAKKHLVQCGCAGVFNPGEIAIPDLVDLFETHRALDTIEAFTSGNAAAAYRIALDPNDTIGLVREDWEVRPTVYAWPSGKVTPFRADQTLKWKLATFLF